MTVHNLPTSKPTETTTDTSSGIMLEQLVDMAYRKVEKPGGGGGGGGDLEARLAKLESSVEYIQRDITDIRTDLRFIRDTKLENLDAKVDSRFLWTIGIIIAVFGGLAGMIAKGFAWF
jgi:hypothetical protein